jgi:hypothetical protein
MSTIRMVAVKAPMNEIPSTSDSNADPELQWQQSGLEQEPPLGVHLTTSRRGYTHHGLYVGRGRVVHYSGHSGLWQCGPVEEVSLSRFANGHSVRIAHSLEPQYAPEEIVRRARSRLGENDYRLLTNNCEHFCNWCINGISRSAQVEQRFRMFFVLLHARRVRALAPIEDPRVAPSAESAGFAY